MKKVLYLLMSVVLLVVLAACSDVTGTTDVKEDDPIPHGYGSINLILPGSNTNVSSRGIYGLNDAIENTDEYRITIISNDYIESSIVSLGDDLSTVVLPGTYGIQVEALDKQSITSKVLVGSGFAFDIEVTAGCESVAKVTLHAIQSEISTSSELLDREDMLDIQYKFDLGYEKDFFSSHNIDIMAAPNLVMEMRYQTNIGLYRSIITELDGYISGEYILEGDISMAIPSGVKYGSTVEVYFSVPDSKSIQMQWSDYTWEDGYVNITTSDVSNLILSESITESVKVADLTIASIRIIVGWETE